MLRARGRPDGGGARGAICAARGEALTEDWSGDETPPPRPFRLNVCNEHLADLRTVPCFSSQRCTRAEHRWGRPRLVTLAIWQGQQALDTPVQTV